MSQSETKLRKGQCLCGQVKVTANKASNKVGVCHCGMCRKRAGGPAFVIDCDTDVHFEGEKNISIYNSSDWGERGFCNQCGSNLFYRVKGKDHYFMSVGLFGDEKALIFTHQIFIDDKPGYYDFKNETAKMTGAEFVAQFT